MKSEKSENKKNNKRYFLCEDQLLISSKELCKSQKSRSKTRQMSRCFNCKRKVKKNELVDLNDLDVLHQKLMTIINGLEKKNARY